MHGSLSSFQNPRVPDNETGTPATTHRKCVTPTKASSRGDASARSRSSASIRSRGTFMKLERYGNGANRSRSVERRWCQRASKAVPPPMTTPLRSNQQLSMSMAGLIASRGPAWSSTTRRVEAASSLAISYAISYASCFSSSAPAFPSTARTTARELYHRRSGAKRTGRPRRQLAGWGRGERGRGERGRAKGGEAKVEPTARTNMTRTLSTHACPLTSAHLRSRDSPTAG